MTATICMALSAVGVVIAVLTFVRGRRRAGLRWLAVALVPTGLYLTGLIPVFHTIGSTLAHWATHLVFDPRVWVGVAMLAGAVLILLGTGVGFGRGRRSGKEGKEKAQVPARGATPAASAGRPSGAALPAKSDAPTADLGDFSDIEEILKRRGI